ncbi:MAG TPA: phosphoribosyltransferase family protein, partial [Sphingomicrobium sp.]|nr:phosphoribosyltransferase family protein [Sphingomicrobium sp.]
NAHVTFVGFIRDLSSIQRIEQELRQAQKMEAVGQLTGGVAHDFNNLLTVILGNLEMLEVRLTDSYQLELVKEARETAQHGAHLTERLLAFGRRQPLRPKLTDVKELPTGLEPLLRRTLSEAVEVSTRVDAGLEVHVDPSQLQNAILNLAINARDAMANPNVVHGSPLSSARQRRTRRMNAAIAFRNRAEAGRLLADRLLRMKTADPVVLALPRGGVPVGVEIAKALRVPLDLLLVRKIGVPWQTELAAAAVVDSERPDLVLNDDVMAAAGLDEGAIHQLATRELAEIERRREVYLAGRSPVALVGRTAILTDDGIATGASVRAALTALGRRGAKRLILAVPAAPPETLSVLRPLVDDVVCLLAPENFDGVGAHYRDFHQLSDREVASLLTRSRDVKARVPA